MDNLFCPNFCYISRQIRLHDHCQPQDVAVQTLKQMIAKDSNFSVGEMTLIAAGKELDNKEMLLSLGEFFFHSRAIYLRGVDPSVCREWQHSGRCTDKHCILKSTHKMENSPRYIEHIEKPEAASSSPPSAAAEMEKTTICCRLWRANGSCPFGDR